MSLLSKRALSTIKNVLGHHHNLHPHLEALDKGKETALDIDIVQEELEYYLEIKKEQLDHETIEVFKDTITRLRNT